MQLPTGLKDLLYRGYSAMILRPRLARVWPPVATQEQLDDLLPRLHFHFPKGWTVEVPLASAGLKPSGKLPYYMADYADRCESTIRLTGPGANLIPSLLWRGGTLLSAPVERIAGGRVLQYLPNVAPFDPTDVEMETFWVAKFHHQGQRRSIAPSRQQLLAYIRTLPRRKKAYLLCTGPSLSRFAEFDYGDGYVIGCNSVVSNEALMLHAKPQFIVASDPIFHFGPSIYAEKFRQDLASAAQRFPFLFLTLNVYHHLLRTHVAMARDRMCEVPLNLTTATAPLDEKFSVPQTANIMTMFMLPLAQTIAEEIYIIGADGREPGETYFWKHDPASQLTDKMQAIKDCHPAFFEKRDYVDYYDTHCAIVKGQIESIEARGGRVYALTPSYIPALAQRPAPAR